MGRERTCNQASSMQSHANHNAISKKSANIPSTFEPQPWLLRCWHMYTRSALHWTWSNLFPKAHWGKFRDWMWIEFAYHLTRDEATKDQGAQSLTPIFLAPDFELAPAATPRGVKNGILRAIPRSTGRPFCFEDLTLRLDAVRQYPLQRRTEGWADRSCHREAGFQWTNNTTLDIALVGVDGDANRVLVDKSAPQIGAVRSDWTEGAWDRGTIQIAALRSVPKGRLGGSCCAYLFTIWCPRWRLPLELRLALFNVYNHLCYRWSLGVIRPSTTNMAS